MYNSSPQITREKTMPRKHNITTLTSLIDHCKTEAESNVLEAYIKTGSSRKAGDLIKCTKTRVNSIIKTVTNRASLKGWAPDNGMTHTVPDNFSIKRVSTLRNIEGEISAQWTIAEPDKISVEDHVKLAMSVFATELPKFKKIPKPKVTQVEELATTYIFNDLHLGGLVAESETGTEGNLELGVMKAKQSIDYLVASAPNAKTAVIADLGDITEANGYLALTVKGGAMLDVSSRYPDVLRAAYELLAYAINLALLKHETVYFYNVGGNHDQATALTVREIMRVMFANNPRVIVDDAPTAVKYHKHGKTLLQFFHGDKLKLKSSGEVMTVDCIDIISDTVHRYGLSGHVHKDSVYDGPISKAESFRTLTPMNAWATDMGFRGQLGTMKAITYSDVHGEVGRNTFNVMMD